MSDNINIIRRRLDLFGEHAELARPCCLAGVTEYDQQKDDCHHTELHRLHTLYAPDLRFTLSRFQGLISNPSFFFMYSKEFLKMS